MVKAHFCSDYISEKVLKLKYVKIMGDIVERKGTTASEIPKSVSERYDANSNVNYAEDTNYFMWNLRSSSQKRMYKIGEYKII
jgi:hypothetical protein